MPYVPQPKSGELSIHNSKLQSHRTVLLPEQIAIPSISTLGFAINNKAELPLIDHFHKEKMEFVILIEGIQTYKASEVTYTLYAGDVFITRPSEVHASGKSPQANNKLLWFQVDLSQPDHFLGLSEQTASALYERFLYFNARSFQLEPLHIAQFEESFHLICSENPVEKQKGQSLFLYCLLCLLDQKPVLTTLSADIDYAKQYILLHIKDTIGIGELMGKSDLSASRFKQKFKEQIGLSPREYINFLKVENTKEAIVYSKQSITDIAFEYSFSSKKYFSTVFKQFTGYSPKEYRKQALKGKK